MQQTRIWWSHWVCSLDGGFFFVLAVPELFSGAPWQAGAEPSVGANRNGADRALKMMTFNSSIHTKTSTLSVGKSKVKHFKFVLPCSSVFPTEDFCVQRQKFVDMDGS